MGSFQGRLAALDFEKRDQMRLEVLFRHASTSLGIWRINPCLSTGTYRLSEPFLRQMDDDKKFSFLSLLLNDLVGRQELLGAQNTLFHVLCRRVTKKRRARRRTPVPLGTYPAYNSVIAGSFYLRDLRAHLLNTTRACHMRKTQQRPSGRVSTDGRLLWL